MSRNDHEFQFAAGAIAKAAGRKADYHEARLDYWQNELNLSVERVRETAGVVIKDMPVTGGSRLDVQVEYGDLTAYRRMREAEDKIQGHLASAKSYRSDARVYATQNPEHVYSLTTADVFYFGLNEQD